MASLRPMAAAAVAAIAFVGTAQAWTVELPPCLDPFQPYVYSGCFEDNGNPNTLSFRSELDRDHATVEDCVALCKGNGYRYAGLEYYGVCFCGQTVNGGQLEEDQCTFPCSGNSSQTCGGNNKISIYQDPTFLPLDDSIDVDDYKSLGCWTDDTSYGKALAYPQDQLKSDEMTSEKCLKACRDGGFPFAGTEYAGECWCGVVIGNDTYSAPTEDCDMPCKGDASEFCGGRGRLNLYVAKDLESLQPCGYVPPVPSSSSSVPPPPSSTYTPPSSTTTSTTSTTSSTTSTTTSSTTSTTSSTTSTTKPPTTTPPTTTTTTSSTTTSSICKETITVPSTCEYKCGKWCASPLPDWNDAPGCKNGYSNCALQVAGCFKSAGFPAVLDCFNFGDWCGRVDSYCKSPPKTGPTKPDFWKKWPGYGYTPPSTTVVTTTCKPSTTAKPTTSSTKTTSTSTTTKCPIPTPTNICIQPTNYQYGYGPGKPVGGIALPVVTCNDLARDWPNKPFKLYTDNDSSRCKSYPRNACTNACTDACKEQFDDCNNVYAQQCRNNRKRELEGDASYFAIDKRTINWKDSFSTAQTKCKAQYNDCLYVNRGSTGAGKCPKFGGW